METPKLSQENIYRNNNNNNTTTLVMIQRQVWYICQAWPTASLQYKNAANQVCFLARKVSERDVEDKPEPRQHIICPLGAALPDGGPGDALGGEASTKVQIGRQTGRQIDKQVGITAR